MNKADKTNQLVGRCPICSAPSGADGLNDAYTSKAMDGSGDKNVYLYWSDYYQLHVCQMCVKIGEDEVIDKFRNDDDIEKEEKRQEMGYVRNYTKNSLTED